MSDNYSRRTFLSRSGCAAAIATSAMQGSALAGGLQGKKIRVAQLGVGHAHAAGKMQAYRQSSEYEVVGVCEPDEALRERVRSSGVYKGLRWVSRKELLNLPG
ncbi:MAG: gfo/Idh/MocA family oxidoreductase, partial [Planctomycetota bacterium]|nr:gfo/Idh/MocA family oxidoreductase [Planctomycetota bacterium]